MVQWRMAQGSYKSREEIQYRAKSQCFTKTMRILMLQSMLDVILKSSREKPGIRYFSKIELNYLEVQIFQYIWTGKNGGLVFFERARRAPQM